MLWKKQNKVREIGCEGSGGYFTQGAEEGLSEELTFEQQAMWASGGRVCQEVETVRAKDQGGSSQEGAS